MTHDDSTTPAGRFDGQHVLRMRGPADMAAMLPYLLGFYPDDSLVVIGLHGPELRQGGAIRLDIPDDERSWSETATDVARLLVELSKERGRTPEAVLIYLCREPEPDGSPPAPALRPLADHLLLAFRELGLPVKESLCLSAGRWWSFLCTDPACCSPRGTAVYTSREPRAVVAAATYAGLAPRGSRRAIAAGLAPIGPPESDVQRAALKQELARACEQLMTEKDGAERAFAATVELLEQAMAESRSGLPRLTPEQSAQLIVGLLDKPSRDRAAEYAEPDELVAAQRLWRYLARRCVAPHTEYAKAPLTLLAWTSWLAGDTATSRVVLGMALELDPDYTLAILLHESLNTSLPPDGLLSIVRAERARRLYAPVADDASQLPDGEHGARPDEPSGGPRPPTAPMGDGGPGPAGSAPPADQDDGAPSPPATPGRNRSGESVGPEEERPARAATREPASGSGEPPGAGHSIARPARPGPHPGAVPRPRGGGDVPPQPPAAVTPQPGRGPVPGGRARRPARAPGRRVRRLSHLTGGRHGTGESGSLG
ncbi:DUF4192 domain-containing protein [Kitasatospora viridis]|uniref:Uncharacterized protein DUF4192 n=1 Tax=Kitasatospora viridis TaxID=281105 RepID=A0A561UE17_9ACTN|nr:DUF4192 domain-containing protein [Kitasatospora viridis]TWF97596.1 uncharacterized protein DUF4192 [Kitasatospora viridis]